MQVSMFFFAAALAFLTSGLDSRVLAQTSSSRVGQVTLIDEAADLICLRGVGVTLLDGPVTVTFEDGSESLFATVTISELRGKKVVIDLVGGEEDLTASAIRVLEDNADISLSGVGQVSGLVSEVSISERSLLLREVCIRLTDLSSTLDDGDVLTAADLNEGDLVSVLVGPPVTGGVRNTADTITRVRTTPGVRTGRVASVDQTSNILCVNGVLVNVANATIPVALLSDDDEMFSSTLTAQRAAGNLVGKLVSVTLVEGEESPTAGALRIVSDVTESGLGTLNGIVRTIDLAQLTMELNQVCVDLTGFTTFEGTGVEGLDDLDVGDVIDIVVGQPVPGVTRVTAETVTVVGPPPPVRVGRVQSIDEDANLICLNNVVLRVGSSLLIVDEDDSEGGATQSALTNDVVGKRAAVDLQADGDDYFAVRIRLAEIDESDVNSIVGTVTSASLSRGEIVLSGVCIRITDTSDFGDEGLAQFEVGDVIEVGVGLPVPGGTLPRVVAVTPRTPSVTPSGSVGPVGLDLDAAFGDQRSRQTQVTPEPGDTVTVDVFLSAGATLQTGFTVVFEYDPADLNLLDFSPSDVFAGAVPTVTDVSGRVTVTADLASGTTKSTGSLGVIRFTIGDDYSGGATVRFISAQTSADSGDTDFEIGPGASFVVIGQNLAAKSSDFDNSGVIGFDDFLLFAGVFGASSDDPDFDARFDLDNDGQIGFTDFLDFAATFGNRLTKRAIDRSAGAMDASTVLLRGSQQDGILRVIVDLDQPASFLAYQVEFDYDPAVLAYDGAYTMFPSLGGSRAVSLQRHSSESGQLILAAAVADHEAKTSLVEIQFRVLNEDGSFSVSVKEAMIADRSKSIRHLAGARFESAPSAFVLHRNFPNPFNPETQIRFDLPDQSVVKLEVFNILGQRVKTLMNEVLAAGTHRVTWDGTDQFGRQVSSGIYTYQIEAGHHRASRQMLMVK